MTHGFQNLSEVLARGFCQTYLNRAKSHEEAVAQLIAIFEREYGIAYAAGQRAFASCLVSTLGNASSMSADELLKLASSLKDVRAQL